jgi:DNA gyrase inhibitor GyrI
MAAEVRIVELPETRVASALGYGPSPEEIAWTKILEWARAEGLLGQPFPPRFFGFNNPNPSPGSPNYGYEQWLVISGDQAVSGEVEAKVIPAGKYAVSRCKLADIGLAWRELVAWIESSPYDFGPNQCLEEAITYPWQPELPLMEHVMDVMINIVE